MRLVWNFLLAVLLSAPVMAQDTAGKWAPTFTARHDGWDVTCDTQGDGVERQDRCYIRYVDIYAPRPNFGVVFLFLQSVDGGPTVMFGREFQTDLEPDTLRVTPGWTRPNGICEGGPCAFDGETATQMVEAMRQGDRMEIGFSDATGSKQVLQWPLGGFAPAYADLVQEATARGL